MFKWRLKCDGDLKREEERKTEEEVDLFYILRRYEGRVVIRE